MMLAVGDSLPTGKIYCNKGKPLTERPQEISMRSTNLSSFYNRKHCKATAYLECFLCTHPHLELQAAGETLGHRGPAGSGMLAAAGRRDLGWRPLVRCAAAGGESAAPSADAWASCTGHGRAVRLLISGIYCEQGGSEK